MGRAERWLILYIILLIVLSIMWNWLENEVYGFSQRSFVDSIFCIYTSYSLATSIENKIHRMLKTKRNMPKQKHADGFDMKQPINYGRVQNAEHCICCGEIIPEGRQICVACEHGQELKDNVIVENKKI